MIAGVVDQALAWLSAGKPAQAEAALRRHLQRAPGDAPAWATLARALWALDRPAPALHAWARAAAAAPGDRVIARERAAALLDAPPEAQGGSSAPFGVAHPGAAEALAVLDALLATRAHDESVADRVVMLTDRARALHLLGRPRSACEGYAAAILEGAGPAALAEADVGALPTGDGVGSGEARAYDGIDGASRHAVARASCQLADQWLMLGEPERALAQARITARLTPENPLNLATVAAFTNYADVSADAVFAAHRVAAAAVEATPFPIELGPLGAPGHGAAADRALRVAWLSPDFLEHSVASFIEPVLEHLDGRAFASVGVFVSKASDAVTRRLRSRCVAWHQVTAPTEEGLATLLRRERIDIAIDLAGLTSNSAIWPLRARVAPVQVTYLGYPATSGLRELDARLVDTHTDPPGAEAHATERLIRLDPCFLCYRIPEAAAGLRVEPSARPRTRAGGRAVVFGSFNQLGKVGPRARALWAAVLRAVPESRLLLKDGLFSGDEGPALWRAHFAALGVDPDRLDLRPKTPTRREHLPMYADMDIGLDPLPYHGTTTTCEAALMGVPVVTRAGEGPRDSRHAARVGVSLNHALGVPDLIASTDEAFVSIAAALAHDDDRRRHLRQALPRRLREGPLGDAAGLARRLEAALRQLWVDSPWRGG